MVEQDGEDLLKLFDALDANVETLREQGVHTTGQLLDVVGHGPGSNRLRGLLEKIIGHRPQPLAPHGDGFESAIKGKP